MQHTLSMNTALPPSCINQKEKRKPHMCSDNTYLDVSLRDSQDDKILQEHIKIHPKVSFQTYEI